MFVVGGGARSGVYPQLLADLLQRPVVVPMPAEYVARGDGRLVDYAYSGTPKWD